MLSSPNSQARLMLFSHGDALLLGGEGGGYLRWAVKFCAKTSCS